MLLNDIRKSFLKYFQRNDHKILASSPLIPHNDPSLLFTNAGMVQFKNQFTGKEKITFPRVATSQKCIRAGGKHNDLENVGYTARHHTFFEMLGNFSFGDYFKEKSILYAWNYLTQELGISKNKLYITVYHEDQEAFELWKKITGFNNDKIIKIKTNDNFWSMGDTGPCGPCSEIFYDHGEKHYGGLPGTKDEDGDRYVEIWNLVFMQFEKLVTNEQVNLPKPSIDTGIGLERITAVMQEVHDNYDIDIFQALIKASMEISGNNKEVISHKIIADHIRSSCFLLADGILPSNEGRGYVLRRIMRRAMRYVYNTGYNSSMLYKIAPYLIDNMQEAYPELNEARELIISTLKMEEDRFKETLNNGMKYLKEEIRNMSQKVFDGKKAFKLYDTYGFPIDITIDILKEKKLTLDHKGFDEAMEEQKKRARANWVGSGEQGISKLWFDIYDKFGATEFIRSSNTNCTGKILAILKDNVLVKTADIGDNVIIITDQTPFYAESGGQVGDKGVINDNKVYDTKLFVGKIHGHFSKLTDKISVGKEANLKIDQVIRNKIKANHSATHLLQNALRKVLGKHVIQKGSLVNDEKLRFDFTHSNALTTEELAKIEQTVNESIILNKKVMTDLMNIEDAKSKGAIALFGEKYEDEVRVVSIGSSIELCGGTHVARSGDIGYFAIVSEESIAAGIRRIEAYTGQKAVIFSRQRINQLEEIARVIKCNINDLNAHLKEMQANIKELQKSNEKYRTDCLLAGVKEHEIKGGKMLTLILKEKKVDLKSLYDCLRNKYQNSVIVIINTNQRTNVLIGITKDLVMQYSAKSMIEKCFNIIDGKGGGNQEVAQASGQKIGIEDKIIETIKSSLILK